MIRYQQGRAKRRAVEEAPRHIFGIGQLVRMSHNAPIVTDAGDHWVLEGVEPANDHFGNEVTVEGEVVGLDRLRVDWLGEI